jgi:hypothetical protein
MAHNLWIEAGHARVWIGEDRANCLHLFHAGLGNGDLAVQNTLWAAYNGVTECVDHWRARGERQHMQSVYPGRGLRIKARAFDLASEMVVDTPKALAAKHDVLAG